LLLSGELTSPAATEEALRRLLEFHQSVVEPISRVFSNALPCHAALHAIQRHSPQGVIEIGAGSGLWSMFLAQRGVAVEAYDRLDFLRASGVRTFFVREARVEPVGGLRHAELRRAVSTGSGRAF